MPIKSRIDLKKQEAERLHALVVELLREDENKYCADCEAKQPRWASWNLGVFLCIRCAGIHRNLGVHLTKIKSVNLDSWTAEQVQSMRVMGNKRAKQVYEAELPEHFRRPQTDQALESFIRAKYEHKRYIIFFSSFLNNANSPGSIAPQIMPPENVIDSTVSQHNNVANLLDFDNEPVPVAALGKEHNLVSIF
ncbi:unnamed protein product [Dracunculus medinensis]|uniref:Arf-GAP domain-containing protein n=1 Tax=Dracunculus medinensis TaxID=318479 RepID=A0A0N4UC26_DRAME|nr:unnamed protein product [Dracunculus medinensis]